MAHTSDFPRGPFVPKVFVGAGRRTTRRAILDTSYLCGYKSHVISDGSLCGTPRQGATPESHPIGVQLVLTLDGRVTVCTCCLLDIATAAGQHSAAVYQRFQWGGSGVDVDVDIPMI